jgi:hypothetical protein
MRGSVGNAEEQAKHLERREGYLVTIRIPEDAVP